MPEQSRDCSSKVDRSLCAFSASVLASMRDIDPTREIRRLGSCSFSLPVEWRRVVRFRAHASWGERHLMDRCARPRGYREKRERAADVVQARCSICPVRWFDPTHGVSFGSCEILRFDLGCEVLLLRFLKRT